MAYDNQLADRIKDFFIGRQDVEVKKMFGGLCFMVSNHMCCGILDTTLMARVGPENYQACLQKPHAREMDFTGRAMKGMVYVAAEGIERDADLHEWLGTCVAFIESLPPKSKRKR